MNPISLCIGDLTFQVLPLIRGELYSIIAFCRLQVFFLHFVNIFYYSRNCAFDPLGTTIYCPLFSNYDIVFFFAASTITAADTFEADIPLRIKLQTPL